MVEYRCINQYDSAVTFGNSIMYNNTVPFVINDGLQNSKALIVFWYGRLLTSLRIVSTSSWSRRLELTVPVLASRHPLMNSLTCLASMMALLSIC